VGITRAAAQLLLSEAARLPFAGTVATLGRQHVYVTWDELQQFAHAQRVTLRPLEHVSLHRDADLARRRCVSDDTILRALGFDRLTRVDCDNYESVDELLDLNLPDTPVPLQQRFDVILDTGTIEHVFHLPHALAHLHRMLRPGGRVIHLTPAANCLEHGFYQLSPTFFADYYLANDYEIARLAVCRYLTDDESSAVDVYDYLAPRGDALRIGGLDDRVYATFAVVHKRLSSTCGQIPQQAYYQQRWRESQRDRSRAEQDRAAVPGTRGSKADRLLQWTAGSPALQSVARRVIGWWRRRIDRFRRWRSPLPWTKLARYS
jgi:SAM-dependent methyltransferase